MFISHKGADSNNTLELARRAFVKRSSSARRAGLTSASRATDRPAPVDDVVE